MKAVNILQGSDAWLNDFRLNGLGSSDSAVINKTSPYKTLRELFCEKAGIPYAPHDTTDKSFVFAMGHKTEELIRNKFQELTGVEMNPVCGIHDEYDYIRASFDGFDSKLGVLEGKLVSKDVLEKARKGEIPLHHKTQIQHQLYVAGADVAVWFGCDQKGNGAIVNVRQDKEFTKVLIDLEHKFWSDVKAGKMPPLSEKDYLYPEDQTLLQELREAKEHMDNTIILYENLKELVINSYNHDKIAGDGIKIYKTVSNTSFNYLKIPEISTLVEQEVLKLTKEYLNKFKKRPVERWTVDIKK